METEKLAVVLNQSTIDTLDSISYEIKHHVNANACIIDVLDEKSLKSLKFIDEDEMNEMIEIRNKVKKLAYKLKNKLNS
jgi:hypothetical protein